MKRLLTLAALVLLLTPSLAMAQLSVNYWGPHPVHPAAGGGFCAMAGSHSHPYDIDQNLAHLYRNFNSHWHFVGNVYEFGYQGPAYPYYGHHPLPAEFGGTFCYLDGPHYHYFLPPVTYAAQYLVHNGYYYYNGGFPSIYYTYRPTYFRSYHTYRYLPYYRPYYTNYETVYTTYARPASVTYIYNPPSNYIYRPSPSYSRPPQVTVYQTTTRTVTTPSAPVYRYNNYRSYTSYSRPADSYRRPLPSQPTAPQPSYSKTVTRPIYTLPASRPAYSPSANRPTPIRPATTTTTRTTTVRTWRR
jgi:hypothetical protein